MLFLNIISRGKGRDKGVRRHIADMKAKCLSLRDSGAVHNLRVLATALPSSAASASSHSSISAVAVSPLPSSSSSSPSPSAAGGALAPCPTTAVSLQVQTHQDMVVCLAAARCLAQVTL